MKYWKRLFAFCLIGAALATPASASASTHGHLGDPEPARPVISSWARAEVARAEELGLIPDTFLNTNYYGDYTVQMTKRQFCLLGMQYLAVQNHTDLDSLKRLIEEYYLEKDAHGVFAAALLDGDPTEHLAYAIGLIHGDGEGHYEPQKPINRQELATLLVNAYPLCGGTFDEVSEPDFPDAGEISSWALESVAKIDSLPIINGVDDDGNFAPNMECSLEQGIIFFLRLYERAPVSRVHGNTTALFSYEQCVDYLLKRSQAMDISLRVDGPQASFFRVDSTGFMHSQSSFFMVRRDGGIADVDLGICNDMVYNITTVNPSLALEDPHFSEDGSVFECTVTLGEDVVNRQGSLLHEKGTYCVIIDVNGTNTGIAEKISDETVSGNRQKIGFHGI